MFKKFSAVGAEVGAEVVVASVYCTVCGAVEPDDGTKLIGNEDCA